MEPELDVLIWDDDPNTVKAVYRHCRPRPIRKAITAIDFLHSLQRKPKVVILNKIEQFTEDDIADSLSERLTDAAYVIICKDDPAYRKRMVEKLRIHGVRAIQFDPDSEFLWISIYNILK